MEILLGLFVAAIVLVLCLGFGKAVEQAVSNVLFGRSRRQDSVSPKDDPDRRE